MPNIKVTVEFQIEDEVYVKTDPEQLKGIVTGIYLRPKDVVYIISVNGEEKELYGFELSTVRDAILATSG